VACGLRRRGTCDIPGHSPVIGRVRWVRLEWRGSHWDGVVVVVRRVRTAETKTNIRDMTVTDVSASRAKKRDL